MCVVLDAGAVAGSDLSQELLAVRPGRELVDQRGQTEQQVGRELPLGARERGVERPLAPSEPLLLVLQKLLPVLGEADRHRPAILRASAARRTTPRRSSASRIRVAVDGVMPGVAGELLHPRRRPAGQPLEQAVLG